MRSLIKTLTCTKLLLFLALLAAVVKCTAQTNIGALHIGAGTTWVSTSDTYVVLDRMDLQYDAGPGLLNNVFRFTGSGINSIRGNSQPTLYAIGVDRAEPGGLWLNQNVNVTNRVNFETGYFNLNNYVLYLQPAALFTNESVNNQLVGNFGGYVTIDADLHAGVTANPGNLGAVITPTTDLGKVTIYRGHTNQFLDPIRVGMGRWYNIVPAAGTSIDATLRFNYLDDEVEGVPADSLSLYQKLPGLPWTDIGYTSRNAGELYVEKQGLTVLDSFTLAPATSITATPPPVTGSSGPMVLNGVWGGDLAMLNWSITAEYQDQHFDIERKYSTQSDFQPVGIVPTKAPGGTSSTIIFYSYIDTTVRTEPDDVSYRIRRVGAGGDDAYSNTITLKAKGDSTNEYIHKLYPTIAVGGRIFIEVGDMPLDKMFFRIVDSRGRVVLAGELPYQSQWLPVHFLSKGIYRIVILSGTKKWHGTFIK